MFLDPAALTFSDPDHSEDEERAITIGRSARQRVLFVAHTEREDRLRIITARRATHREQEQYEEGIEDVAAKSAGRTRKAVNGRRRATG